MKVGVYNVLTQETRNVSIAPNTKWGGKGLLGCQLSMGDEYTIPVPKSMLPPEEKKSGLKGLFSSLKNSRCTFQS